MEKEELETIINEIYHDFGKTIKEEEKEIDVIHRAYYYFKEEIQKRIPECAENFIEDTAITLTKFIISLTDFSMDMAEIVHAEEYNDGVEL